MSEDLISMANVEHQTKNSPENTFILFIFLVLKNGEEKKDKNTANAALI